MTHHFAGMKRVGEGTLSEHMASIAAQLGGVAEEAAKPPPLRAEERYLWDIWVELSNSRSAGFVANPISYTEIEAWTRLRKFPLSSWEVGVLRAMDSAALAAQSDDGQGGS